MSEVTIQAETTQEIFYSEESHYRIIRARLLQEVGDFETNDFITITGNLPSISISHLYDFTGNFTEHPKYGKQFVASVATEILPKEKDNIVQYIKKLDIPGIGVKTIEKLYDFIGPNMLETIAHEGHDPLQGFSATGWNERKANNLVETIQSQQALQMHFFKLIKYGFPSHIVSQLYEQYKDNLEVIIQTNAYQLLEDFDGLSIKMIDKIVQDNFPNQLPKRTYYAIIYYIKQCCYRTGNSYALIFEITELLRKDAVTPVSDTDFNNCIAELIENKKVYAIDRDGLQLDYFYHTEHAIAARLLQLAEFSKSVPYSEKHIDKYIADCESEFSIKYAHQQKKAMHETFKHAISLVTGGPGTGKTTIIKTLLKIYTLQLKAKNISDEQISEKIALLAPTGRAAQRMTETTGESASTIHRFLGWDKNQNTYRVNEEHPNRDVKFVIVDEASMIDMWLLSALLKALPDVEQIIFVGDRYQLPSVGVGQCFADMLQTDMFSVTELTDIYRQKKNSTIIDVASQINTGTPTNIFFTNSEDYSFLEMQPQQLLDALKKIALNALKKGYSAEEIQVLAPLYKTTIGIDAINNELQTVFNPDEYSEAETFSGPNGVLFLPNDKVIQLKNMPDYDVYNGDIGMILSIEKLGANKYEIAIDFNGNIVLYNNEDMRMISHAYCISIHKSQGSEFPVVIMPVFFQYSIMLYRQLMYTGASRAKKSLIILGQKAALLSAIQNNTQQKRDTNLLFLLNGKLTDKLPETIEDALYMGVSAEQLGGKTPFDFLSVPK